MLWNYEKQTVSLKKQKASSQHDISRSGIDSDGSDQDEKNGVDDDYTDNL
jgi:hypothetical protein